jgi:hypothetical protein
MREQNKTLEFDSEVLFCSCSINDSYQLFALPETAEESTHVKPIDATSRVALVKLNGQDWTVDHYISICCLSFQA